jgi:5-carboxymethyl-2-hydroxymuconate isomerase
MPHLVILYTPQIDAETDMPALCRRLADTMLAARDDAGEPVFPTGGTRVLAYPATHYATTDGSGDHAFCYFHLRMGRGRGAAVHERLGQALVATAREHLAPLLASRPIGLTLQIDEGPEVFDGKFGNLHELFARPARP